MEFSLLLQPNHHVKLGPREVIFDSLHALGTLEAKVSDDPCGGSNDALANYPKCVENSQLMDVPNRYSPNQILNPLVRKLV